MQRTDILRMSVKHRSDHIRTVLSNPLKIASSQPPPLCCLIAGNQPVSGTEAPIG